MGKIVSVKGSPKNEFRVRDLDIGQSGWATEWSIRGDHIDNNCQISKRKGGTASVRVTCVGVDEYMIEYETPIYRDFLTGEYSEAQNE